MLFVIVFQNQDDLFNLTQLATITIAYVWYLLKCKCFSNKIEIVYTTELGLSTKTKSKLEDLCRQRCENGQLAYGDTFSSF